MQEKEYKTFETERLLIRPTAVEDAKLIFRILNTPKWLKFVGDRKVYSEEDAAAYIKNKMIPQLLQLGYSNNTIIRKEDEQKIGICGLYKRDGLETVDIGFAYLPEFEGMGYGYEAANRILQAASLDFHISEVCGITVKENIASQRLLEKLGLKHTKMVTLPGDEVELLYYEKKLQLPE